MTSPTLQFKRGLFVNLPALRAGEPGFTTDKNDLYIGIGAGTTASNKFYGSSRYWSREDGTNALELKLVDKDGVNGVSLRSPASAGAGVTYTLPGPGGTTGYFLKLGSNDTLEWASVSENATLNNATLAGVTTVSYIDGTNADFSGIATASSFYVDSTKVLSTEGGLVTLSGISTIDATTKSTLETILKLDPNDFDSLNVTGIATVGGEFYANGNVSIGNSTTDTFTVAGIATFDQTVDADISGNAGTATALETARNISVSGIVTGTASFDGTSDITISTTIENDVVGLGTHTYGNYVESITAGDGLSGDGSGEGSTPTLSVNVGAGITISSDNVAFRNAANLSDNTLQKWDDANEQLVNTIITDNGTTATVGGNLTVTGDLTVNGTSTVVNTTELAVYDRTITLGIQTGSTPSDTSWDLGVLMNYGDAGVAKTAGVIWEFGNQRFQFASNASNPAVGVNTTTPDISVAAFAPIEVGGLWVNNSCSGGAKEVVGCVNSELHLQNVVIDAGLFV